MKKQLLLMTLCVGMFCGTEAQGQDAERLSGYVQAERFTKEKLNTMLFFFFFDPHWFQKGNSFWYEYKTGNGKAWYVVDPVAKTKRPLFDLDDIAAQITEIVKDPFTAATHPETRSWGGRTYFHFPDHLFARCQKGHDRQGQRPEERDILFLLRLSHA